MYPRKQNYLKTGSVVGKMNDPDLEMDFVDLPMPGLAEEVDIAPKYGNKNQIIQDQKFDSGYTSYHNNSYRDDSLDYELKNVKSVNHPVQCSDSLTDADTQLQRCLKYLSLDDEGIWSMSDNSQSYRSNENHSLTKDAETDIVEVDPYETDRDGDSILHQAILSGYVILAEVLIDLITDIDCLNITNLLRQTALHLAVLLRQTNIVSKLVARGADVTLRDHQGNTPLHVACRLGDRDAVETIVASFGNNVTARKAYFALKNCEGLTCLHIAAQKKEYVIMGHLFVKGADVNMGDAKSGRTVLHYAAETRDVETVTLLLTHKDIDVDCKTFKGETPLVMAYWRHYTDIVKRLRVKGAYFSYDIVEESDDELS